MRLTISFAMRFSSIGSSAILRWCKKNALTFFDPKYANTPVPKVAAETKAPPRATDPPSHASAALLKAAPLNALIAVPVEAVPNEEAIPIIAGAVPKTATERMAMVDVIAFFVDPLVRCKKLSASSSRAFILRQFDFLKQKRRDLGWSLKNILERIIEVRINLEF